MAQALHDFHSDDLVTFDVGRGLIEAAQTIGLNRLSPLQVQAVLAGVFTPQMVEPGRRIPSRLVLAGPAGCGKKTLAELAAAHRAHMGCRVLVVVSDDTAATRCARRLAVYGAAGLRSGPCQTALDLDRLDLGVMSVDRAIELLVGEAAAKHRVGLVLVEDMHDQYELLAVWPRLLAHCQVQTENVQRFVFLCDDVAWGQKLAQVLRAHLVCEQSLGGAPSHSPSPGLSSLLVPSFFDKLRVGVRLVEEKTNTAIHLRPPQLKR